MGVVSQLPKMGRSAAFPKMGAVSGRRMLTQDGKVDVWPAPGRLAGLAIRGTVELLVSCVCLVLELVAQDALA